MAMVAGTYVQLQDHFYFIPAKPVAVLPSRIWKRREAISGGLIPATVIAWSKHEFVQSDLEDVCARFSKSDDVWSRDFSSSKSSHWELDQSSYLRKRSDCV